MSKKRYYLLLTAITSCIIFSLPSTGWGQIENIGDLLRTGQQDAEVLTRAYLEPIPNGIGGNLNTGWFNTASTHKTLGFDIQIRGALAFIPSSDQQFDVNALNLQKTSVAAGESSLSPTAGGDNKLGPELVVRDQGDEVARFNLPKGSGLNFVPAPMIQASLGLIKKTDLTLRYVPKVNIGDNGDFTLQGIGIKHSLSQWLPGGNLLPVDISIFAGYNHIDINTGLNLDPDQTTIPPDPGVNYDNQKVETSFNTFTAKVVVGKSLPFIGVYGGVGYETSTMDLAVTGNYPITVSNGGSGTTRTETITDPFSYNEQGDNQFSLLGGVKFKLLFFHIFGEYTFAKYSVANAGIGFSFR